MQEARTDSGTFGQAAGTAMQTAGTIQTAHAVIAAAKSGAGAAGAAVGTALGGPLGACIASLAANRTVWKVAAAVAAALFLWLFIIVNFIGIILSYLGFLDADDFANEAQSTELSRIKARVELILEDEGRKNELLQIIEGKRNTLLQEIETDRNARYGDCELTVIDEYEIRLKKNLNYYLAILLSEKWDRATLNSFLGVSQYGDMATDLSSPYDVYFEEAARTYNVPAALLISMGMVESGFNPNAVSPAGAIGVMQLMPATAASLGVANPYDPRENIMGAAKYMAQSLEMFQSYPNGLELAIAAYNAGPGGVINAGYQVPHNGETEWYVEKVMGYLTILETGAGKPETDTESPEESGAVEEEGKPEELEESYVLLKGAVEENLEHFFTWSVTDETESGGTEDRYYFHSASGTAEVERAAYESLKASGGTVSVEPGTVLQKRVEYTLAVALNIQVQGSASGYSYRYVMDQRTFELVLRLLELLQGGVDSLKEVLFTEFSWTDFVTGGSAGDSYYGDIDATGDVITYDTVGNCVKKVTYFNQGEAPWAGMAYGTSTIGEAGCGPTSLSIVISTLTGENVNPQVTSSYAISNGEYVSGVGTCHSFPTNAARNWGLTCERVGKDRMDYIIRSLKEGKMVVEICEAYTITGGASGHFIVLTGVTADGYITIADCASRERTAKVYSPDTILSYGRDLSEGAFWIIGK